MKPLKQLLSRLAGLGLLVYLALSLGLYFFQEKLLFHPSPFPEGFRYYLELPFEERALTVDGAKVDSLLVRAPGSRGLVLMFRGNAGNLADWAPTAEELARRLGWDIWLMDYPGFGRSEGAIRSEAQLHRIAAAFFEAARGEAGSRPLVIYGRSIGSGLAAKVAAENRVSGLVLETPYLSITDMARRLYPWAPLFLLRYPLRSDRWVPLVKSPLLFLHGDRDEVIPHESGAELALLSPTGRFVTIEGGRHNDLSRHEAYWAELASFLEGVER